MRLTHIPPRLRATILAAIIGLLAGVAAFCYLAYPLVFPGFGIILAFLFAGNFLNLLIFGFLGDHFPFLNTEFALPFIVVLGNPVVLATFTWLLWPTMKRLNRIQVRLPRFRAKPPTTSSPPE